MKWLIIISMPFLLGFVAIHSEYDKEEKIVEEFRNVYDEGQAKKFEVVNDTPALNNFPSGNVVIFSSNTVRKILFRVDQDIFAVDASCITVRR